MELGVAGLNAKAAVGPSATVRLARLAEELGYTSWWAGEHVVLPSPRTPQSPMAATDPILDPLVHLAYVAAVTTRLRLGTAIVILPQRNPLVLAKQVASLDTLSRGRLTLGVGAGYLEAEMTAVGVPMAGRGTRTDEYIDAMTSLWTDTAPAFTGKYVSFADVDAHPRPASPRIVIGGHSPAAFRRAVSRGHGWFGTGTPADLRQHLAGLQRAAGEVERPARLGQLEINYMQFNPVELDSLAPYEDLGVDNLMVYPLPLENVDDVAAFLERNATL
jgi:probable F420-dependent oxidoreductase